MTDAHDPSSPLAFQEPWLNYLRMSLSSRLGAYKYYGINQF